MKKYQSTNTYQSTNDYKWANRIFVGIRSIWSIRRLGYCKKTLCRSKCAGFTPSLKFALSGLSRRFLKRIQGGGVANGSVHISPFQRGTKANSSAGFTLIETLVAVSLLVMAIAAPMSLASQSLRAAFYTRDQMTASHLAQEAIEAIRNVRDGNILKMLTQEPTDLLANIPNTNGDPFIVDALAFGGDNMEACPSEGCKNLRSNGSLFGYEESAGWEDTRFVRTVRAWALSDDEVRIDVEVSWKTGAFPARSITISGNLYRWVDDES